MPIIDARAAWNKLPLSVSNALYRDLKVAIAGIATLQLKPEQISCQFNVPYICDEKEIIVFVVGLFAKPNRTQKARQQLADVIRDTVLRHFPEHFVEVFIEPFDPKKGFATSPQRN